MLREIGYQCGTSEATVVRFCQRIGYRGLSEMKMVLARELAANLVASRATANLIVTILAWSVCFRVARKLCGTL